MKTSLPASVVTARLATTPSHYSCLWAALGCVALAFAALPARAAVTEAWVQRYNGPATGADRIDEPAAVAVDKDGNVVVTGSSWGTNSNSDYYTAKYAAATGARLWERRYNGPGNGADNARAMAVDGSGNVLVTGSSYNGTDNDFYTAKYAAADGALLWEKRYNGPANGHDSATAITVDKDGNVVVTGFCSSGIIVLVSDIYTAKYAAADGALLWERSYNGPGNKDDYAISVAVDKVGNVVVTGYSFGSGTGPDYYTAKYGAADGALLWEQRYNGPANKADYPWGLAVDASGNVVVAGSSFNGTNDDCYTAKYAAADGALLWEQRYNGPGNSRDVVGPVVVDSSGNVVVTGGSVGIGTGSDCYTAKYAATNGALLWEKRYNGPGNGDDGGSAVAVDQNDNVVVTGYSFNGSNNDYYTAKYAAADGALLWEKSYNGPDDGSDGAVALALGPNGMVAITGSSVGAFGNQDFATVVYRENLTPLGIAMVTSGVRLRFTGVPGSSYTIERAPAATGPWDTLATPTAPLDGLVDYIDANPPTVTAFYRTRAP